MLAIQFKQCLWMKRLLEYIINFVQSQHETQEKCIFRAVV